MRLGESSTSIFPRRDSVFSEDEIGRIREASKNGSLVARTWFDCTFEALSKGF